MNGKRSKALRRMAEAATIGSPARDYEETTQGKTYQYGTDPLTGMPLMAKKNNTIACAACTRAVYQGFKRNHKAARTAGGVWL